MKLSHAVTQPCGSRLQIHLTSLRTRPRQVTRVPEPAQCGSISAPSPKPKFCLICGPALSAPRASLSAPCPSHPASYCRRDTTCPYQDWYTQLGSFQLWIMLSALTLADSIVQGLPPTLVCLMEDAHELPEKELWPSQQGGLLDMYFRFCNPRDAHVLIPGTCHLAWQSHSVDLERGR